MDYIYGLFLVIACVCFVKSSPVEDNVYAGCYMTPNTDSDSEDSVSGSIQLRQKVGGGLTDIKLNLTGFDEFTPHTKHGLYITERASVDGNCRNAGGHFNPLRVTHGAPYDTPLFRHFGDLGNVKVDEDGDVETTTSDYIISLQGDYSVIGRSFMIGRHQDDMGRQHDEESLKDGHMGEPIACCVIGVTDGSEWEDDGEEVEVSTDN